METPEVILTGSAVIKLLIDTLGGLIPENKRKRIPVIAILFGLGWSVFLLGGDIALAIYRGVAIGAGAVGINEVVGLGKKKE